MKPVVFGYDHGEVRVYRAHDLKRAIGLIYRGTDKKVHLGVPPERLDTYSGFTLEELENIIGMMQMVNGEI